MPVARNYTKSQWNEFARTLDALPEKPEAERGLSVRDAMKDMRGHIRTAQVKGYTLEQIAEQGRQAGIDITAGTIRYALRPGGKGNSAGNAARPAAKTPAQGTVTALSRAHAVAQGGASRANSPRAEGRPEGHTKARPHGGKAEVKPQPVPAQGSLAFAIKPDTDDL